MRTRRRLFLGTWLVIALLTKADPDSAHEYSRLGTVESIVVRGTYQLDDSIFIGTIDKIQRDGHFYSHQMPLLATIEAPIYWLLHLPGTRFNNRGRSLMTFMFSLLTNGLALAATVMVFWRILALAGVERHRELLAFLLPFGTWLLPYGVMSNNHGIAGLLVALLIWLLLSVEWQGATRPRALAIGGVLGLLIAIELLPIVSFVPLSLIYLARRRDLDRRAWLLCGLGLLVPLLAHSIINIGITGDVIPAGFHHELFRYPGSAFQESELSGTIKYDSWSGFSTYAWRSLLADKAFFTFAPLLLAGLLSGAIAWRWWARARGVHLVLLGSIVVSLLASLLTTNNFGGEAVGFRHAVYLAPALVTLLLPWIAGNRVKPVRVNAVIAVAVLSTLLMLLFAVRKPWSVLSLSTASSVVATQGSWEQYLPIIAKIVHGDLFKP
jgi:hypothetical protein